MPEIDRFLATMLDRRASDLHLSSGRSAMLRVNGELVLFEGVLEAYDVQRMLDEIIPTRTRALAGDGGDLDFAYELPGRGRFRVNGFVQERGPGAVFRIIPTKIPTMDDLGLPPVVLKFARLRHGLVLVTGPTGSGKSTTLAAVIDRINTERSGHLLTIEDPIEFVHENKHCLVTQREVGCHAVSFASALRSATREDPDVVLVGEMRDLETVSLALSAAETGALVFGTLHTNSASKTVDRLIDVFPEAEQDMARAQLAGSLKGIVSQQLLRTADGKGRVAALEIAVCTFGVANLIREGRAFQLPSVMQAGRAEGMQTLEQALAELVEKKRITRETAWAAALNKEYLTTLLGPPSSEDLPRG
jgi:twitching motility protein PilT